VFDVFDVFGVFDVFDVFDVWMCCVDVFEKKKKVLVTV